MRLEPLVARRKYELELERLDAHRQLLQSWGCWIVERNYPYVAAMFVPRRALAFTFPVGPAQTLITLPGQQTMLQASVELPVLAARAFGVRVHLDDFDIRAPSVTFHDAWTWEPLEYKAMFRANYVDATRRAFAVLLDAHPVTRKPFLCMRGIREYHEHPQHTGDEWFLYRGEVGLMSVLMTIWQTCVESNRPNLLLANQVQVRWEAVLER